jgi:O-6-methylguanine DNA methyltransferase
MWQLLKRVPSGKVTTYGALARTLGSSPRAVGAALRSNLDRGVPCYKVVMSDGRIGGYARGINGKVCLLKAGGIKVKKGHVVDFGVHLHKF